MMGTDNITTVEEVLEKHNTGQRLLGLDLGTKTIGIAVSDGMLSVASSLETIKRTKFSKDVERLKMLVEENTACAFVLGLPLNMDGSEGPRAQATRAFARNLAPLTSIPIIFWDERLSTVAAERVMIEADLSRKKRAARIDAAAAAFILQGVLDRIRNLRN